MLDTGCIHPPGLWVRVTGRRVELTDPQKKHYKMDFGVVCRVPFWTMCLRDVLTLRVSGLVFPGSQA